MSIITSKSNRVGRDLLLDSSTKCFLIVNNNLAGIDIPNVDYVFNLNLKKKFQYLRNASHAGRGNRNGKVLSFVNEEYPYDVFD